jgi:hypothetical protein
VTRITYLENFMCQTNKVRSMQGVSQYMYVHAARVLVPYRRTNTILYMHRVPIIVPKNQYRRPQVPALRHWMTVTGFPDM